MTDEDLDDDLRDEALAARLAVEPLDDVTRRRLVTNASAEYEPAHRSPRGARWLAAAAAVVLLLVGGIVLLVAPGDSPDRDTAAPARTPAESATKAPAPAAAQTAPTTGAGGLSAGDLNPLGAADASSALVVTPTDVGDFGNLDRAVNLARLRRALTSATPTTSAVGRNRALVTALAGRACTGALPPGTITAVATGTLGGNDAIVVLTTLADGTRSIDAVVGEPCTVRPLS